MTTSHGILLRMKNVSDKTCRENQNTFYTRFYFKNRVAFDNVQKCGKDGKFIDDSKIRS